MTKSEPQPTPEAKPARKRRTPEQRDADDLAKAEAATAATRARIARRNHKADVLLSLIHI
jgi:hypothetical protein